VVAGALAAFARVDLQRMMLMPTALSSACRRRVPTFVALSVLVPNTALYAVSTVGTWESCCDLAANIAGVALLFVTFAAASDDRPAPDCALRPSLAAASSASPTASGTSLTALGLVCGPARLAGALAGERCTSRCATRCGCARWRRYYRCETASAGQITDQRKSATRSSRTSTMVSRRSPIASFR
jgi:hypothetical protein